MIGQEEQANFIVCSIDSISKLCATNVAKPLASLEALKPLPVYSEENEKAFFDAMLHDSLYSKLVQLSGDLEQALSMGKAIAKDLRLELDEFFPDHAVATSTVSTLLSLASANTCLRILFSTAAASQSAFLLPTVTKTMDFVESKKLDVPKPIMLRFKDLQAKLESASSKPAAKAKAKQ